MKVDRDVTQSKQSAWDQHELDQLKYFRSLPLRTKLEAVEGMADVIRRFEKMREEKKFYFLGTKGD